MMQNRYETYETMLQFLPKKFLFHFPPSDTQYKVLQCDANGF